MRTELYRIKGPWPGCLAITPRPRGGDWLEDEILSWRRVGIAVVVSTLTKDETAELDLARERELCETNGIQFVPFPITDRGVPSSLQVTAELVRRLEHLLQEGKNVAVHCRQGVGRSALVTACLLVGAGLDPAAAFDRIQVARGCGVPDTTEQREWVSRFARDLLATLPREDQGMARSTGADGEVRA
jgi:protein-tyrosine phosphatase